MPKAPPSFVARLIYVLSVAALVAVIIHGVYSNFLLRDVVKNAPSDARFITDTSQSYAQYGSSRREFILSKTDVSEIKTIVYQQFYFGPLYILFTFGLSKYLYFLVKGGMREEDAGIIFDDSYNFLWGALVAWLAFFIFHDNIELLNNITISPITDLFFITK